MAELILVATSYDGLPSATRAGQNRVKTLSQAGFHKPGSARSGREGGYLRNCWATDSGKSSSSLAASQRCRTGR